jgi:xylan 1,4-beta-xylosidase
MITFGASTRMRLRMPWRNAIAVGRAFDLVRADMLAHLRRLQEAFAYRYCRFHAIFDEDMDVVVRRSEGGVAYQWHHVDQVYDALLAMGIRPFVELNAMPKVLASGTQEMFWYKINVTPPRLLMEWEDLIEAFARHLVDRYGMEEVRAWYFEVWNEPNLGGFWSGTREQYFQLYDASARALKRVDPGLRVGGPATSKASWLEELIDHCAVDGVPLDFVSTHLYPQDEYVDFPDRIGSPFAPGGYFAGTISNAHRRVEERLRLRGMPRVELHFTEWNSMTCGSSAEIDWVNNPTNDSLHGAAFVAANCIALDRVVDTMAWWVASDVFVESGLPHSPFSMTYGMLTIHGIPKSSFHAFRFLRQLRGELLAIERSAPIAPGTGLSATTEGPVRDLLLWNQRLLEMREPEIWRERLRIPVDGDGEQLVVSARIGAGAGSAYESWLAMGAPHNLAPAEESALRAHAEPTWTITRVVPVQSVVGLDIVLLPGEVLYLQVRPLGARSMPRSASPADLARWNALMGEASR